MSWHQTPLAAQLIADMHTLSEMSDRYLVMAQNGGSIYATDETADAIGTLEWQGVRFRCGNRLAGKWAACKLVGHMLDRLDGLRDEWVVNESAREIEAAGLTASSEAADAIYDTLNDATDSVGVAIDHWVAALRRMVA